MKTNVFIGVSDSVLFREVLSRFCTMPFDKEQLDIVLVHVFRKATSSELLMGEDHQAQQMERFAQVLDRTREHLLESGYHKNQVTVKLIETPYAAVADGLMDQIMKGRYDIIVLGRNRMSKAEEFVLGDPCTRLVRHLENTSMLIFKGR